MQVQPTAYESIESPDPVIPAVPGEFYGYSAEFTTDRPIGFLMKCKANKSRPITDAGLYPEEHDMTFVFKHGVHVCSPNSGPSIRLLDDPASRCVNRTWFASTGITEDQFQDLRRQKNIPELLEIFHQSSRQSSGVLELSEGKSFIAATESGKYALVFVKQLLPTSVRVEACHVLL